MRKPGSAYLAIGAVFLLLGLILIQPPRLGPGVLDAESGFYPGLHNSLYYLDQAKGKWAEEKHKTDHDVPTMEDLTPYLGEWTNHIAHFVSLGIAYKITPISEMDSQTDIATLTRDLRFQRGFCRYYPAGTSYCIQTGWVFPQPSLRAFYINNQYLLAVAMFVLAAVSLLAFVIKRSQATSHAMRHIEGFMNWLTDMDWTWQPFLSLRPPKNEDIDNRVILRLAPFFGCTPVVFVFMGVVFEYISPFTIRRILFLILLGCTSVLFGYVFFILFYKFTFAYFWNRRARRLRSAEHKLKETA